jgi:hypothetical protein
LIVALQVSVAEADAAAKRLFTTAQQRVLRLTRNQSVEVLLPVDPRETLWQDWQRSTVGAGATAF